jgi:hypothetical protein
MLEEESLDLDQPIVDAEIQADLGDVNDELARMRPELELAVQDAVRSARDVSKLTCAQQRQLREQAKKFKEMQPKIQKEMKNQQEKLKIKIEQLRRLSPSFDI